MVRLQAAPQLLVPSWLARLPWQRHTRALFRPAAVSGKIGFRFWGTGTERATIFKRIAYVQSLYPKLNVTKYVLSQNGYQDFPELLTEIASGTAPDALRTLTYQPTQLVAEGNALLDLSPYVNSDSSLDTSDFVPVLWKGCFVDGKVYAMPDNGEPYVVYYNQKAFKDAGIPTPATLIAQGKWNEQTLLSSAQALMAKGGMKYGVAFESWNYDCFAFMGGGTILDSSLKPVIDKSPTPETYQYFADLINKYKVAPSSEVPAGTVPDELRERLARHVYKRRLVGHRLHCAARQGIIPVGGRHHAVDQRPPRLQARDRPGSGLV